MDLGGLFDSLEGGVPTPKVEEWLRVGPVTRVIDRAEVAIRSHVMSGDRLVFHMVPGEPTKAWVVLVDRVSSDRFGCVMARALVCVGAPDSAIDETLRALARSNNAMVVDLRGRVDRGHTV